MISLRSSHTLLVVTSALMAAALSTFNPMLLALAVASVLLAGQIVGQTRAQLVTEQSRQTRR